MKIHDATFEDFLKKIASNIKKSREERSLTQEQCSEKTEIEYKYYQKIEQGQVNLTLKTLYRICLELKINPKDLL